MTDNFDRKPTHDEQQGMDWWNGMSRQERIRWLKIAGNTAIAADAWAAYKRHRNDPHFLARVRCVRNS